MRPFLQLLTCIAATGLAFTASLAAQTPATPEPPPIKALLVSGGASHDYATRTKILVQGIRERLVRRIEWVVRLDGVGEGDAKIPLFESSEWAKGYDIVVHDHCFPRVKDSAYVDRVLAPHRAGIPAVLLHGSMMSFRTGDSRWFDFTGAEIRSHEPDRPVKVEPFQPSDPILKAFRPWEITGEELYRVESLGEGVLPLAGASDSSGKTIPVVWTHRYGPAQARVFATSLGNATATLADPLYLDLVARGFLWSLGSLDDASFRTVPPAESLKGFALPATSKPLLRPGRNAVSQGVAAAFQWGQAAPQDGARLALDGDPFTAWKPPGKGPGWWEVRFPEPKPISLAAVWWEGQAPDQAVLEGNTVGETWLPLATLKPPAAPDNPVLARFESGEFAGLRLSVPRTQPGSGFAIREVAAYRSEEELPSAILAVSPDPPGLVRFRTAGPGDRARIRLAPGWQVERLDPTDLKGKPGSLLPTASGGLFLSLFPSEGGSGAVHRIETGDPGGLQSSLFLSGISPDTLISWDGEWLYTLSGPGLERVRKALGRGPADERQRFGELFQLAKEGAPVDFAWTDLRIGDDGWLVARYRAKTPGTVIRPDGHPIALTTEGSLRFRRDGSGLSPDEAEFSPLAIIIKGIAEIDGLLASASEDDRLWFVISGSGGLELGCLVAGTRPDSAPVRLDEVPTADLPALLETAAGESTRREIAFEISRRKGDPLPEVNRLLAASPPDDLAESLVAAVAVLPGEAARTHLIELATSATTPPAVRAAAFRALGDVEGELDPEVFRDLGTVTDPVVTAAIFEGMRRRKATLPGAEVIALRLSQHPDRRLARAAFDFLHDRGAVDAAFAALDASERREDWPGAFALLAASPTDAVVDGIATRLKATLDPQLRLGCLETLCRLRTLPGGTPWSKTSAIDSLVHRSLTHTRVDRAALLAAMDRYQVPPPDPGALVAIARDDPSLEPYVIDRFIEVRPTLSDSGKTWLQAISKDPDRDGRMREKATALLAGGSPDSTPLSPKRKADSTQTSAAPVDGRKLFRYLGCAVCHNLDGEGPSAGPDLIDLVSSIPPDDWMNRLLHPGTQSFVRIEIPGGRQYVGCIEDHSDATMTIVDFAGNRFSPGIRKETLGKAEPWDRSPCQTRGILEKEDHFSLLDFLRNSAVP